MQKERMFWHEHKVMTINWSICKNLCCYFAGIGVGLATSAAFVALNHYFSKKRGQAVGLSMAGTGE